jgi:hypothetical protein
MNATETAAGIGVGLVRPPLERSVAVDDRGALALRGESRELDPKAVVAGCCEIAAQVFATCYHVVSAKVAAVDGDQIALVTVSEHIRDRVHFNGATAIHGERSEAALMAATRALGLDEGILVALARRWQARPGILALSLHGGVALHFGPEPLVEVHAQLLELAPGPGRLSVTTESAEHRLLVLPSSAAIVTVSRRSMVLGEVASAFEAIEAHHRR